MSDVLSGCVIVGLCSFAITYMLKYTDGPFDAFAKLRVLVGLELPVIEDGIVTAYLETEGYGNFFAKLFACFWCLTTWICLFVVIGYILLVYNNVKAFPFLWFGGVGLSGFLHGLLED